jgi:hypothetical protein
MKPDLKWLAVLALAGALCACGGGSGSSASTPATSASTSPAPSGTAGSSSLTDVLTYHNDFMRTGQNLTETALTPTTVNSTSFGLQSILAADGVVDATPLVVTNLTIAGATRTVVYFATENDSVYAYDANSFQMLAKVSLLAAGETAAVDNACDQVTPQMGVTATPAIDRKAGPNGTLFLVAMSMDASGNAIQRVHALDLVSLADRIAPVTIQASFPGNGPFSTNGSVTLDPKQYKERGALLLANGQIYTGWASNCDINPYTSWVIVYSESTLAQTQLINLTPNGSMGAIWNAGGLAADSSGSVYAVTGNGTFDSQQDYGNAAIRLTSTASALSVADFFTPSDTVNESAQDLDLCSGTNTLLPDQIDASGHTRQLMLVGGKNGNVYLIDRTNMGGFNANANQVYQELDGVFSGWFATAAYYNGTLYMAGNSSALLAFPLNNALLATSPSSQSSATFAFPGSSPAVSANGTSNAIVWALEGATANPAVLHAYNAANLGVEYYNSNQAANSRDAFGNGNKFVTPVIANGKVFAATPTGVAVFGILQ